MILEAKYEGPLPRVTVPGFEHRIAVRGETVKLRIREGHPLGGHWEILKGKKEYEAGLKKAQKELETKAKAKAKAKADQMEELNKTLDKVVEASDTAETPPDKKGGDK